MLHCSEQTGNFQFVSAQIEALPSEHFLATYSHSLFRPVSGDMTAFFEKLIRRGVTQHYGITDGDQRAALRDLTMMLGFDYEEVD